VTAFPDVTVRARDDDDDFIMLACDGIWDCLTNEQCIDNMRESYLQHARDSKKPLSYPVEVMLDAILAPNTDDGIGTDNMTAILIMFKGGSSIKDLASFK